MRIFVVGDSTLAKFNDQYYYPRYGYATMLDKFFNNVEIINNALSGRSSRSYILDPEYKMTFDNLKKGDYLIIGFGHNDEKEDDFLRFSDASLDINNEKSFKYSIYNNYIKPALEVGAIPIITTPVVRISTDNNYSGYVIHDTPHGNYCNSLLELGKELNINVFDLTTPTKKLFETIGYDNAIFHHAMTQAIKKDGKLVPDTTSVDKTHLNIYGAKYVAWLVANGIKNSNLELKNYLKSNLEMPTINDLIPNPDFKFYEYNLPDLLSYNPNPNFKTYKKDVYGTALGIFNDPNDLYAYEDDNKFIVGTKTENGRTNATCDSYCLVFKQLKSDDNFKISAKAVIKSFLNCRQSAFGIQLRDDIYINANYKRNIASNYVSAGLITSDASTNIIYSRATPTDINKESNYINEFFKAGEELSLSLERLGQKITVNVVYRGKEYNKNFFDFDLIKTDNEYIYICLSASKGVVVEYSDIDFEITGKAKLS